MPGRELGATFAALSVLVAGILWGCLGIFVRLLNAAGLFSMEIVTLRAVVTCVLMGLLLLVFDRKKFRIRWKDLWCFLGTGLCSIVFFNYCYFRAISMSSMAVAAILLYTAPAIVMVLSYGLFHESLGKRKMLALVMTFGGCVLVTGVLTDPGNVTGMGILVGLGAGFGYALYSIFSRFAIERGYDTMTITFYTFLFASVGSACMSDTEQIIKVATQSMPLFLLCLAMGVLGTVIPYLTYTLGLQHIDNGKASILASIEPVTASVIGVFLYHETISAAGIVGIVMVIAALMICNKDR